jgi:hypothetical protein
MNEDRLNKLIEDASQLDFGNNEKLPPIHQWNPELSGKIAIRIDEQGFWSHEGSSFTRKSIVNLFSKLIVFEENKYYLISPTEKWEIEVAVAPFVVIDVDEVKVNSIDAIRCRTLTEQTFLVDEFHAIWLVMINDTGEKIPFVKVRDNLNAFFNRAAYYKLMQIAIDNQLEVNNELFISSMNKRYSLGAID